MVKLFQCLILCVLVVWFPGQNMAEEGTWWSTAAWVADGDTFRLVSGEFVRMMAIDAPETANKHSPSQYFAREAKNYLQKLILEKRVKLKVYGKDRYDRFLCDVWLPDGRWVNRVLVEEGMAFYYFHKGLPPHTRELLDVQRRAIQQDKGFWPKILGTLQAKEVYLGHKTSRRFHTSSCPHGKRISKKNLRVFSSLRQAFLAGFAPARKCTPWPGK